MTRTKHLSDIRDPSYYNEWFLWLKRPVDVVCLGGWEAAWQYEQDLLYYY